MEFLPSRVSIHVNRRGVRLKVACREHAAHHVLKDMLLDGIEAVLFAQRIDKRDLGRVRPNLREQIQINIVHCFAVLLYEPVNGCDIRRSARVRLRDAEGGDETEKSGEQIALEH